MIDTDADVAVIGSGFAGSLMALILNRIGLRTVLIDKGTHPRFAIGESSTPIADCVLRDLARRYDLPQFEPLSSYGSWQRSLPHLRCGLKRGFSYFQHEPNQAFMTDPDHGNELLVTASSDDARSDTHWFRADVDQFFADEVVRAGIPFLDETEISEFQQRQHWQLTGQRHGEEVRISARFLIDAGGGSGVVGRAMNVPAVSKPFRTNSSSLYAHFKGVPRWRQVLERSGGAVDEHPFDCDNAAQHHLLDGAWMWILRFRDETVSAGLVIDNDRWPDRSSHIPNALGMAKQKVPRDGSDHRQPGFPSGANFTPQQQWADWLARYPSLNDQFATARLLDSPGHLIHTPRLQRRFERCVGPNWAMLPHAAGFVDPLHSTGIAHSLCAIERLAALFERFSKQEDFEAGLREYEQTVFSELSMIDALVHGCYRGLSHFRLFASYAMFYFAAATTYEHRRADRGKESGGAFLCADDRGFREAVETFDRRISQLTTTQSQLTTAHPDAPAVAEFERDVAKALRPTTKSASATQPPEICTATRRRRSSGRGNAGPA